MRLVINDRPDFEVMIDQTRLSQILTLSKNSPPTDDGNLAHVFSPIILQKNAFNLV
jgi:hypothetical protein